MSHDPLCPNREVMADFPSSLECGSCTFISRVRDDERAHMGIIDLAYAAGLDAAREAVKRLPERYADGGRSLWEVLSAIDALKKKSNV